MLKKYPIPLWSIILMLVCAVGSITLYAWDKDTTHIEKKADINYAKILTIETNYATKEYVKEKMIDHEKLQESEIETLNTRLNGLEKTTNNTEKMVEKLLDLQLNTKK